MTHFSNKLLPHVLAVLGLSISACQPAATPTAAIRPELTGTKTFLTDKTVALTAAAGDLEAAGGAYFDAAAAANFDYSALWTDRPDEVMAILNRARTAWVTASPLYEQMEGIVAGVPTLAEYDVILDAGASGEADPDHAVPFDLTLDDGRVLRQPGNLFGVTESTLWGTEAAYQAPVSADWDANGQITFGESLPDAQVLKASTAALARYARELQAAAAAWTPTEAEAFQALVTMVPTMNEYFNSWKSSRFVAGDAAEQRDFVAISRLADIGNILGGLEIVYADLRPMIDALDAAQGAQVAADLTGLKDFVAGIYQREQGGERFTPEEADTLGAEAQNRATAITGQIAQLAARLGLPLEQ